MMSALAMAMYLTGAGGGSLYDAQRRRPPPAPVPSLSAPMPPPLLYRPAPPPPPPPARFVPPARAAANLSSYFSIDDYPAAALRGEEQGTTGFRLSIGANGRVTDCAVTQTSGSAALDAATCRILRSRARYIPARDYAGNPAIGSDSGRVTWRLPQDDPHERAGIPIPATMASLRAPFQSYVTAGDYPAAALRDRERGAARVHVVVDMIGRVIACDIDDSSGSAALDDAACRVVRARARYVPARNAAGGFVCDVDWGEISWRPPPPARRVPRPGPIPAPPPPIETQLAPGTCPGQTR
jgi:TonB family protein